MPKPVGRISEGLSARDLSPRSTRVWPGDSAAERDRLLAEVRRTKVTVYYVLVDATVRATLEYTISVGVQATTLFTGSQMLIPTTPISGVSGIPELATSLSVSDDSTLLLILGIGGAAGCGVAVTTFFVLRRRSKRGKTGETSGNQHA